MFESFTTALVRKTRYIVSSSVAIATAIGVLSVAGAGTTSYLVEKSETDRIAAEQNALRAVDVDNGIHNNNINYNISLAIAEDLDDIKYIAALSAQTSNRRHNAIQLRHKVTHMFSKNTVLSFNDPASECWFSTVKSIVANNSKGFTRSEVKEATIITADLSTVTTTVVPLKRI